MIAVWTLFAKEVLRFCKVGLQTIAAPAVSSMLYLLIFAHAMAGHPLVWGRVPYTSFLVPGLVMMTVLQNAFANASSSLIQSKITGNLVFLLLTPMRPWEIFVGYVAAALLRGLVVGAVLLAVVSPWLAQAPLHPLWALAFAALGSAMLGSLGLVAGIWSEKFDHMAAFQNFLVVPATFLSGVFYSVNTLPGVWLTLSHLNPFFYLVDGFRYGFFGVSDVPMSTCLLAAVLGNLACGGLAATWLQRGTRLRA